MMRFYNAKQKELFHHLINQDLIDLFYKHQKALKKSDKNIIFLEQMIFEIENDPALQVNVEDSSGVINFKAASIIKKLNALKEETKEILDKQLRRKKKILEWFDAFAEIVELRTFELQNQLFL